MRRCGSSLQSSTGAGSAMPHRTIPSCGIRDGNGVGRGVLCPCFPGLITDAKSPQCRFAIPWRDMLNETAFSASPVSDGHPQPSTVTRRGGLVVIGTSGMASTTSHVLESQLELLTAELKMTSSLRRAPGRARQLLVHLLFISDTAMPGEERTRCRSRNCVTCSFPQGQTCLRTYTASSPCPPISPSPSSFTHFDITSLSTVLRSFATSHIQTPTKPTHCRLIFSGKWTASFRPSPSFAMNLV